MKSRKHIIFYILSAVFLALVQEAFFNDLRIFGVKPNLTLALLCVVAVRMNFTEAMIYGLSTGLFVDISCNLNRFYYFDAKLRGKALVANCCGAASPSTIRRPGKFYRAFACGVYRRSAAYLFWRILDAFRRADFTGGIL